MARRRGRTRSADREKARGRLGTPTSGQFSRWGPASRGSAKPALMTLRSTDVSVAPSHNPGWCDRSPPSAAKARRAAVVLGARLRRAERGQGRDRGRAAGHAGRQGALPGIATSGGGGSTHDGGGLGRKLCLRFLILTAARSGEARGATWAEIDLEAREWRIPGARMKKGREHRVPLSDAAAAALERARGLDDGSGLVFLSPLRPGRPSPR